MSKISHDALLHDTLLGVMDRDIKYYVYLKGPGMLPWPRIVLKNKAAGSHEVGRVLQPEDADRLRTMLISDVDTAFHGTIMERGYVSLHTHFGINQSNKEFIKEIDEIYNKARPFVNRLKDNKSYYVSYDGYCYHNDPERTKIITSEAADPRAVAGAGAAADEGAADEAAAGAGAGAAAGKGGSRKYKKSKRVLRRKSRSTRRR